MTSIATFLPFIKVGSAFILMLIGIRNGLGLVLSILAGGYVMGLLFGVSVVDLCQISTVALVDEKFLQMLVIVASILTLSGALEKSGQSKRLMEALSGYLTHPRLRLIFFPALIGLLPMPGGAVFSAPMVKSVSEHMNISNERQALINYWFRHVWELVWPMYPGLILTVALAEIPILHFISATWPGVICMFVVGWLCYLRPGVLPLNESAIEEKVKIKQGVRTVAYEGLPLLVAIVGSVSLEMAMVYWWPVVPMEYGVIVALLSAVCCTLVQNKLGFSFLVEMLSKKSMWSMLAVIVAVFVFKDIMQKAGIVAAMADAGGSFALFSAAVILPFLVGVIAGINVAFVGATFPLLLGILHALNMESATLPYIVLASFAGFSGVLVSPLHICFLLTCRFFGADAAKTWKQVVFPSICFFITGCVVFGILI